MLIRIYLVLVAYVVVCDAGRKEDTSREATRQTLRPWQINQNLCPPSLCPTSLQMSYKKGTGEISAAAIRPQSFPFFEGDIILGDRISLLKNVRKKRRERLRKTRAAVRGQALLWKKGIVPFVIDPYLSDKVKSYIKGAHNHIQLKTCITFRERLPEDKDYIYYVYEPGCWSYIGVQKGPQRLALGSGCDNFGTIVHETVHALGFWHEQSRRDRDKFIKVLKDNIAPSALMDFNKLTRDFQNSRGFPYDYMSVMHYGDTFFSRNGKPTIEVKGIGKELGLNIGQRVTLSDLDVAQLRDMYKCNKKITGCPDKWVKLGSSCYRFVKNEKLQFAAAEKFCAIRKGKLISIEDSIEDYYIKKYLIENFPKSKYWRTGGKKYDNYRWIWHHPDRRYYRQIRHTRWAPGQPGASTTMILSRNDIAGQFEWQGTWAGSANDYPKYAYSFICEKEAVDTCVRTRNRGRDYIGKLDYTISGITCQRWISQYPHKQNTYTGRYYQDKANGLGNHNYCRNPDGQRERPWCYTTKTKTRWEYCDVKLC